MGECLHLTIEQTIVIILYKFNPILANCAISFVTLVASTIEPKVFIRTRGIVVAIMRIEERVIKAINTEVSCYCGLCIKRSRNINH